MFWRKLVNCVPEWTEVILLPKAVNMIMAISQRVFVGEPLCRSQEWVSCYMLAV